MYLVLGFALNLSVLTERFLGIGERAFQFKGGASCLRGMSFVNDNGKVSALGLVHFLIYHRELLQGCDDDTNSVVDKADRSDMN